MKNKLIDLNDHLFTQLERLSNEHLKEDKLRDEIERSKAIVNIGMTIVSNARLSLEAHQFVQEYDGKRTPLPAMIELKEASV